MTLVLPSSVDRHYLNQYIVKTAYSTRIVKILPLLKLCAKNMLRSLSHPLKPLLYLEWLFLGLALLHPWIAPTDALAIINLRDGRQAAIAVGLGTSNPWGWLIPITWLVTCIAAWRIPQSNKQFIALILFLPLLLVFSGTNVAAAIFESWHGIEDWSLLGLMLGYFIYLGLQVGQKFWLNKWLYTVVEFLLVWYIYFSISELHTGEKHNLESLLLLHLVALIRACLMFVGKQRWVVIALLMASYQSVSIVVGAVWSNLFNLYDQAVTLQPTDIHHILRLSIYNVTIIFTAVAALMVLLVNTLVSERRNREQLAQAHSQLRQYAQRIEDQAILEERNRIAREIHDALGHTLTAQSIQLENALVHFEPEPDRAYQFLTQAKTLSQTALQEVRRSVAQIRTHLLADRTLETAVAELIAEFQQNISCQVDCQIESMGVPIEIQTTCYRIIQAALTNITRHSGADQVLIRLTLDQPRLTLWLQITDNGRGFHLEQTTCGFGLQGMRERAAAIGGQWSIKSAPGQGCQLQLSVPIYPWLTSIPSLPSGSSSSMIKP
jgi:signal transduction histidine kinase